MCNHSRKLAIRNARRAEANVMEVKSRGAIDISFGPLDDRPMLRPHHDALVIRTDVERVWVTRTFVDTKSLVNLIYFDCLQQLDMNAQLQPSAGFLFKFLGESERNDEVYSWNILGERNSSAIEM